MYILLGIFVEYVYYMLLFFFPCFLCNFEGGLAWFSSRSVWSRFGLARLGSGVWTIFGLAWLGSVLLGSVRVCLGSFWVCLTRFGLVWLGSGLFGLFWVCLTRFGVVWARFGVAWLGSGCFG